MKINNNIQLLINIIASFITLFINMAISFFFSPFIVEKLGPEAYGFIQLANNLISYLAILTISLNSMSSRFISVSYFRGDKDQANQYFTSTFFANLILCILFIPILIWGVLNIDILINIPTHLIKDVRLLMLFMAINFLITLLSTNLGISYYIKNKLYIANIISVSEIIIRAVLLYILFIYNEPRIFYIGLVTVIITIYTCVINLQFKSRMIPEFKIEMKYFSIKKINEMILSGVWNTITRLGTMLSEGLDLLITNIFINSIEMGTLSLAKTIPNIINSILNSLIGTFMPNLTELYAQNNTDDLVKTIKRSMKIIGIVINIPIALLIAFGDILFSLWIPTQDSIILQILAIITILPWAVMGQATILHNVFTIVNKLKINSILVCLTGVLNVPIVFILLKNTSLGLFAVAGVSTILSILRNMLYTVPFGAIYINQKWYTFFPEILKSITSVIAISTVGNVVKLSLNNYSWVDLFILSVITALIGIMINYLIVLNKEDRTILKKLIVVRLNTLKLGGIKNG